MHIAPDEASNAEHMAACSTSGTVVGTVASVSYVQALVLLSQDALAAGFPCIIVQTYDAFVTAKAKRALRGQNMSHVRALSLPKLPLLPRTIWCKESSHDNAASRISVQRYGWRRSHLYRTRMWRAVLENGYNLLAVDLDWSFVDMRSVPLQPAGTILRALQAMRTIENRTPDVVALHDGPTRLMLNVGCMFVRSTRATIDLAKRVENRSRGAWDQAVFNEELNFAPHHEISCCHTEPGTPCNLGSFLRIRPTVHDRGHVPSNVQERRQVEGQEMCSDEQPLSAHPPARSTFEWSFRRPSDPIGHFSGNGWDAQNSFNELRGKRRSGRCTMLSNLCQCGLPNPPEVDQDDAFRSRNPERILRFLMRDKESANKEVNSSAFHRGMEYGWPPRQVRDPSYVPSQPILLREWLRPFISPMDYASILRAQWEREEPSPTPTP